MQLLLLPSFLLHSLSHCDADSVELPLSFTSAVDRYHPFPTSLPPAQTPTDFPALLSPLPSNHASLERESEQAELVAPSHLALSPVLFGRGLLPLDYRKGTRDASSPSSLLLLAIHVGYVMLRGERAGAGEIRIRWADEAAAGFRMSGDALCRRRRYRVRGVLSGVRSPSLGRGRVRVQSGGLPPLPSTLRPSVSLYLFIIGLLCRTYDNHDDDESGGSGVLTIALSFTQVCQWERP